MFFLDVHRPHHLSEEAASLEEEVFHVRVVLDLVELLDVFECGHELLDLAPRQRRVLVVERRNLLRKLCEPLLEPRVLGRARQRVLSGEEVRELRHRRRARLSGLAPAGPFLVEEPLQNLAQLELQLCGVEEEEQDLVGAEPRADHVAQLLIPRCAVQHGPSQRRVAGSERVEELSRAIEDEFVGEDAFAKQICEGFELLVDEVDLLLLRVLHLLRLERVFERRVCRLIRFPHDAEIDYIPHVERYDPVVTEVLVYYLSHCCCLLLENVWYEEQYDVQDRSLLGQRRTPVVWVRPFSHLVVNIVGA
mmetsp:Transcript_14781/g.35100  ORF Transcript_14781/g.35100 Transcript_14781/m.35100 type:complete len:306 (-) Transcript_14781:934-1851(-)